MRSFTFAISLLAIFAFSTPVFADSDGDSDSVCTGDPHECDGGDGSGFGGNNTNTNTNTNTATGGSVSGTISPTFTGTQTGTVSPTISPTFSPTLSPTFSTGPVGNGNGYNGGNTSEVGDTTAKSTIKKSGNSEVDVEAKSTIKKSANNEFDSEIDLDNRSRSRSNVDFQIGHSGGDYNDDSDCYDCDEGNDAPSGDILSPSSNQEQEQDQDQGQHQGQIAAQGQFGYVDSHDVYEAQERNPVSSAAPVSASACSSGVSAQGVDLGGAVAVTNIYCNLALTAEVAKANGKTEIAGEMVTLMRDMAVSDARGIGGFRTILRSLPVLGGNLLRWIF